MTPLELFDAGFEKLVSVVPPHGQIDPTSTLKQEEAGKVPGKKNYAGLYHGYPWPNTTPLRWHVEKWEKDGNNIGFDAGVYPAIDIDVTDADLARSITDIVIGELGVTISRYGRRPKCLLVYRAEEKLKSYRVKYEHTLTGETQLVEFLGYRHQYVMLGTHPVTKRPYEIEDPLHVLDILGPEALPVVTAEAVDATMTKVTAFMEGQGFELASRAGTAEAGSAVDQESLKAPSIEALQELVASTPNDLATREEWVNFCYAIKGAGQDDLATARDVWLEWCARWEHYTGPADAEKAWATTPEPYRSGFDSIRALAQYYGVNTSHYLFGEAEERPEGFTTASGLPPEVKASREALDDAEGTPGLYTDAHLTQAFVDRHGSRCFFLPSTSMNSARFFEWNGRMWKESSAYEAITRFCNNMSDTVRQSSMKEALMQATISRLGSRKTVLAIQANLMDRSDMTKDPSLLDADLHLLNTPNGIYDLRTGRQVPPDPKHLITRMTAASPDWDQPAPVWNRVLRDSMLNDEEAVRYLQVYLGYCLTGETIEQTFHLFHGHGADGKSRVVTEVKRVMGDSGPKTMGYAASVIKELLQVNRRGQKTADTKPELARIAGARLIISSETDDHSMWDAQAIKQITGEDEVSARFLFGQTFNYRPTYKILVVGNKEPDTTSMDRAMTRRIKILPWLYNAMTRKGGPDKRLERKLQAEDGAVMAWLIDGAVEWYESGMPQCAKLEQATEEYAEEQNTLGRFIREQVTITRNHDDTVINSDLLHAYKAWMSLQGEDNFIYSPRNFKKQIAPILKDMGVRVTRGNRGVMYRGMKVAEVTDFIADNVTPLRGRR